MTGKLFQSDITNITCERKMCDMTDLLAIITQDFDVRYDVNFMKVYDCSACRALIYTIVRANMAYI